MESGNKAQTAPASAVVQTQTPAGVLNTPAAEIVFRTDSDNKSIVLITRRGEVKYASPGRYGGYILYEDIDLNDVVAYYVEPKVETVWSAVKKTDIENDPDVQVLLPVLSQLPDDVKKLFDLGSNSVGIEKITYTYVQVRPIVKKKTEKYTVLDFEPLPGGKKVIAKAVRAYYHIAGSARHPRSETAGRLEKELKLKYPDDEVIQKYLYAKNYDGYKGRGSTLFLKVVVDAPQDLLPSLQEETAEEEVAEVGEPQEEEGQAPPQIELKPRELALELPAPLSAEPAAPSPELPTPTLETQPTVLPLEQAPPQPPPPPTTPSKSELVKIYLLSMRLPSRYLVQKVTRGVDWQTRQLVEERRMDHEVARRIDAIRMYVYRHVQRIFAHVEEYGVWIAVSNEAVKEASEVSNYVIQKLSEIADKLHMSLDDIKRRYGVRAVPVYMEPTEAKLLLEAAIASLSADVDELKTKIEEAQKARNKTALSALERDMHYKRALLEAFRKYLATLPTP